MGDDEDAGGERYSSTTNDVEVQMIPSSTSNGATKKRTKTVIVKAGKVVKKKLVKKPVASSKDNAKDKLIKYAALFLLVGQMVGLVLLMRYSRTHRNPGQPLYLASSAVFAMEVMKFVICCFVIAHQSGGALLSELKQHVLESPWEMLKLCVPSLLYTVQNNLLYLALSNLDAATYQVCYQLKILTTAVFSALLLQVGLMLRGRKCARCTIASDIPSLAYIHSLAFIAQILYPEVDLTCDSHGRRGNRPSLWFRRQACHRSGRQGTSSRRSDCGSVCGWYVGLCGGIL